MQWFVICGGGANEPVMVTIIIRTIIYAHYGVCVVMGGKGRATTAPKRKVDGHPHSSPGEKRPS